MSSADGGGGHVEPLGQHDLERVTGPDVLLGHLDHLEVFGGRGPAGHLGGWGVEDRHGRRRHRRQRGRHPIQSVDRVGVRLLGALRAVVPVHRVGDQSDRALVVVQRRDVGGQQHGQLWQMQLVNSSTVDPLQPADDVVAEIADHPAGERRQAGQRLGVQQFEGSAQHLQRVTVARHHVGNLTEPGRLPVAFGEHGGTVHPDERPARPRLAGLRGFEQERARPVGGERRVQPDRREGIGQQGAGDRDDPAVDRQLEELGTGRADGSETGTAGLGGHG